MIGIQLRKKTLKTTTCLTDIETQCFNRLNFNALFLFYHFFLNYFLLQFYFINFSSFYSNWF